MKLTLWLFILSSTIAVAADSLPKLTATPQDVEQLWANYDPRTEPLDVRIVREWQEDDLTLRYITYSIGSFNGESATMAAFYGFPTGKEKLPAVMHMHGGGQRAFQEVVKRYAKRGYRGFHDWYTLNINSRHHWFISTRKLADPRWEAPHGAKLSFEIEPTEAGNALAVELKTDSWRGYSGRTLDTWLALVPLSKAGRQRIELDVSAFTNPSGKTLGDWYGITELIFQSGAKSKHAPEKLAPWKGDVPRFFDLRWSGGTPVRRQKPFLASRPGVRGLEDDEFAEAINDSVRREQLDASLDKSDAPAIAADVIVYGSTPGGFCAAIAAAREGASVFLLEPTDHVGGLSTGGLSHCDSNQMVRSTLSGLFDEWHNRIIKDYTDRGLKAPYDPAKKDQSRWTFEPHVAMRVTEKMLDEAGVKVHTKSYLKSVTKDGPRIKTLITKNGTFTARVFVDGTYEGDLMAAAGVDWTIGREGRAEYGESLAGKQYPKQKMNINGFGENGKLLPLVTTMDAGDDEAGDRNIMTYSFRLCLTSDPDTRVPMPKPTNYDPARFELARRLLKAGEKRVGFDLYPLPGEKLDGNNSIGGQLSIGLVGGANDWHSADEEGRRAIWERHKQYTLELIHFLTTDPSVPAATRDRYAKLGLCRDEFASYDHFSPALYVRESRRMKGLYVITQNDILKSPKKEDPIAISSFPIDSHDCQRIALEGGGVVNEGTIFPVRNQKLRQGYAYHVPYRSILPKPEQCSNLLVPVALSCTHVGISSLRIEATWMVVGQAAGVAAAIAADQDVAVQDLKYEKLRKSLLRQKQVLALPDLPTPAAKQ